MSSKHVVEYVKHGNNHGKHVNVENIWTTVAIHMANYGNPIHPTFNTPIDMCKSRTVPVVFHYFIVGELD